MQCWGITFRILSFLITSLFSCVIMQPGILQNLCSSFQVKTIYPPVLTHFLPLWAHYPPQDCGRNQIKWHGWSCTTALFFCLSQTRIIFSSIDFDNKCISSRWTSENNKMAIPWSFVLYWCSIHITTSSDTPLINLFLTLFLSLCSHWVRPMRRPGSVLLIRPFQSGITPAPSSLRRYFWRSMAACGLQGLIEASLSLSMSVLWKGSSASEVTAVLRGYHKSYLLFLTEKWKLCLGHVISMIMVCHSC